MVNATDTPKRRGRPPGVKRDENKEKFGTIELEDISFDSANDAVNVSPTTKNGRKSNQPKPKKKEKVPTTATTAVTTAVTTTATTTKPTTPTKSELYTKSIARFDNLKEESDLVISMNGNNLTLDVTRDLTSKSEFFEIIAAGSERMGFTYNRYNPRYIYLSSFGSNYSVDDVAEVIKQIATDYKISVKMNGDQNSSPPDVEDMLVNNPQFLQQKIEGFVHSLLKK